MDCIPDLSKEVSLGNWIGYETNGVFSYEDFDESGNNINTAYGTPSSVNPDSIPKLEIKYVDQNGDGLINDEDITVIARTQPKHYGSVTIILVIKNSV